MPRRVVLAPVLAVVIAAWGGGETVEGPAPAAPDEIRLTSPAFAADATIPPKFTCEGDGVSPPLAWTGVPAEARSLALLVEDPDAPGGTFVHWTVFAVAPDTTGMEAGAAPGEVRETVADAAIARGQLIGRFGR